MLRIPFGLSLCSGIAGLSMMVGSAAAQPTGQPVYSNTVPDAVANGYITPGGVFRWSVPAGADNYFSERYERPTASTYYASPQGYGAQEYFEYLDIARVRWGVDQRWLYVSIDLVGRDQIVVDGTRTVVGLMAKYGFRFSDHPDGRGGYLIVSDQPEVKNLPNTVWGPLGTFIHLDTDGDVGGTASSGPTGLLVSKEINPLEDQGLNGYDSVIVADGASGPANVLFVRIDPTDITTIEIALDYVGIGLTRAYIDRLAYFDAEAFMGLDDPQKFHRNDKFTALQAGSPNPGLMGGSEFGTEGLSAIYEIDNVRLIGAGGPTRCIADVDDGSGMGAPDGGVTIDDLLYYLITFNLGSPRSDVDNGSGTGTPDGGVTIDDLLYFLYRFDSGC